MIDSVKAPRPYAATRPVLRSAAAGLRKTLVSRDASDGGGDAEEGAEGAEGEEEGEEEGAGPSAGSAW